LAAVSNSRPRSRVREIREHTAVLVEHLSPHGYVELDGGAGGAVTVRALAVAPALAAEDTLPLKESEVAQVAVRYEDDVAALAAVAAVRPALGDEFLAAKANRAVAAATALDRDAGPVVEQRA
jgi:hypothetical protein